MTKKSMKQTWILLAAALITVVGIGCGGAKVRQTPIPAKTPAATARPAAPAPATARPAPVPAPTTPPAYTSPAAPPPVAKTAAADDELDLTIRDASDYLNDNIPQGSKIVILNIESVSAKLSEYIIDELIANAVNDKKFSVVDRRQLEAIQSEQKFQMSGAVNDADALAIGKFFGAQTIISGAMMEIGRRYRLTIRALEVQTAKYQAQNNWNMTISETLAELANSSGSGGSTYRSTAAIGRTMQASATATSAPAAPTAASTKPAEPPIQGIMVPGTSLSEKLVWLSRSADSHNTYILEVTADESIAPHTFSFEGGINITIVLRGDNVNRTIRLKSNGTMFEINKNVTFILDNNITLMGHSGNNGSMVYVHSGTFKMRNGAMITGNINGGNRGGGVYVYEGTFEMTGGTISGNTADRGGGIFNYSGTFTMSGGIISGNTAKSGGGVYNDDATIMRGGTITGNTASEAGGGLYLNRGPFTKTGGIITSYSSDQNNSNVVKDGDGYTLARKGHAVYVNADTRKETTSGPNANMSYGGSKGTTGDWDK